MNTQSNIILFLFLTICFHLFAKDEAVKVGDLYYYLDSKKRTAEVTYPPYSTYDIKGSLSIPASVSTNGIVYTVNAIGEFAFYDCKNITSVAFPDYLTEISWHAFDKCTSLSRITIPASVKTIEPNAFIGCTKLKLFETDKANPYFSTSLGILYSKDFKVLLCFPGGKEGEFVVPDYVSEIGDYAFYHCTALTGIILHNSIKSIGRYAFSGTKISEIIIPNSVTSIGEAAFSESGITRIKLPGSITRIEDFTFDDCKKLESIDIPPTINWIGASSFFRTDNIKEVNISDLSAWFKIEFYDFFSNPLASAESLNLNGEKITTLEIPSDISVIKKCAFEGYKGLTKLIIPPFVTEIGARAFRGCKNLQDIEFNDNLKIIEPHAFGHCESLTEVILPNSVIEIGGESFSGCSNLKKVRLPDFITSIDIYTFDDCRRLTDIEIPCGVTSIGAYAFSDCVSLSNINIPNAVTSIGYQAFYNTMIKSVVIPNSVVEIESWAFGKCWNLKKIIMGNGLKKIAYYAFRNTIPNYGGLMEIYITTKEAPELGIYNFTDNTGVQPKIYTIPSALEDFREAAYWCDFNNYNEMIPVSSFSVDQEEITGVTGEEIQLTATVFPEDATLDIVFWTSTDINCAIVNENGLVTIMDGDRQCWIKGESIFPDVEPVYIPVNGMSGKPDNVEIIKDDYKDFARKGIFTLQGVCIKRNPTPEDISNLPKGLYIINGKKSLIK